MSTRRDNDTPLTGGRAPSSTQAPGPRPEPGSGGPVLSTGPEASSAAGSGSRARPPAPAPTGPTLRVVLVSRDNMLAGALRSLIEAPGSVRMLDWHSDELDSAIRHADVVVVDMPSNLHRRTFAVIDGRFLGRTVVLLQEGEHPEVLPQGPSRAILYRPLQIGELWGAVTGALPSNTAPRTLPDDPGAAEAAAVVPDAEEPEAADTDLPDPDPVDASPTDLGPAGPGEVEGQGLPVAESGRLIGLSGQELQPVIGAGQVAPGMDEATLERLRRWGNRGRQPATGRSAGTEAGRAGRATVGRAKAAQARRERARQAKETEARERQAAREQSRRAAAEASQQAKEARAAERTAAREASRQAKEARATEQAAARERMRRAKATQAAERTAARQAKEAREAEQAAAREQARLARQAEKAAAAEVAREAEKARAAEQAAAREAARQAKAAEAAEKAAVAEAAREAKKAREAELAAAKEAERQAKAARAVELAAAREAARKVRAEEAAARRVARAGQAEQRRVAREESRQARAARAEVRRAARAEAAQARATQREESKRVRAARAEERRAARAQARQERAARTQARREQSRQERVTRAEERRTAREAAAQAKAAAAEARREETQRARAAQAEARKEARAEATRQRAARAEARTAARDEARQAKAARAEARQAARAAQAEQRRAARAEARRERAAQAQVRRDEARRVRAARAEARKEANDEAARQRAARAEARKSAQEKAWAAQAAQAEARRQARAEAAREEARRARLAKAKERRAGWPEARQVPRRGTWAGATHRPAGLGATPLTAHPLAVAGPVLVVLALAAVGLAAAGWRGGGGPDTVAGEVAVVRAAEGSDGGLVAQDPRVGPIAPLHALAVGAWLRVTEAGGSLEGVIREARGPSRVVLAGVVGLTVLLVLLLMRVGPGSGAAAGPGPAPPRGRRRRWRLLGAALAGALVALDPLLVRSGRAATGTILAVALALGALALAWALPARPELRWVPLVGAVGGLALLVTPLALPVLAVPVVAELLEGRHREAWRGMAALGLAVGLWLLLPIWVAGQGLDPGQVGWLLGRPPGRGPLAASLTGEPLSWLLVAAGLTAALLAWRLRSGARPGADPGAARLPAWAATTAAGALVAIVLGYPASQALAFAIPAAAVSLSLSLALLAATTATRAPRWIAAVTGVALAGLLVAQGLSWGARYGQPADDGLGRLVATLAARVPACSAVNAAGPDDRARLLAAGVTVTEFSSGPAAHAAGVRYFALTGATGQGGPQTRSLAAWVRQHGSRLADLPSPSLSGIELWRVDAAPLDPVADIVPIPGGIFSNVTGSACGGYRVVDSQLGAFHTGYRAAGGKAVLGRPLGTVWTSAGPALQAFETMVLGATPSASGRPDVKPIELPPLLAKLDVEAVADADIPLPSTRPPVTDRQARALLDDRLIARAYLGTSPGSASAEDWRRARERFGRPLGRAQAMPDGAVRQPFERAVLELPADGGPVRPAALGRLAVRLGLVPRQAMRPEAVPGLPARPAEVRLDPGPLLRPLGVALVLLAAAAAAGAVAARRSRGGRAETARTGR